MLSIAEIEKIRKEGWLKKNISLVSKLELLKIGEMLGHPISSRMNSGLIDELIPLDKSYASKNSLSFNHGTKGFPLHTDTAYKKNPVKYIILYMKNPGSGSRPTLLVDGYESIKTPLIKLKLESAIFKIKNGKYSFLSNMLENTPSGIRLRFDQGCMIPATRDSSIILNEYIEILRRQQMSLVDWSTGDLLIIDNWRMLHGRGTAKNDDSDRLLYRLNIL
jgi:alpha-ketoglutarate-dependent taurine dioxygenase